MKQHRKPRGALHQRPDRGAVRAEDEVALPVARNRAIVGLGGTLADHDLLADEALAAPMHACSGDPQCSAAAQTCREFASQRAAALHVERLIDRAVSNCRCESACSEVWSPSCHQLCWCAVLEACSWPVVELDSDLSEALVGDLVEVGALREVLA